MYIVDYGNNVVRKVTISTGIITTIAGNYVTYVYSGDGGAATSAGIDAIAAALDSSGRNNIYSLVPVINPHV